MSNDTWLSQLFLQRPLPIDAHCTIHIGLPPWPPTRGCGDIGLHTEVRTITTWNVPTLLVHMVGQGRASARLDADTIGYEFECYWPTTMKGRHQWPKCLLRKLADPSPEQTPTINTIFRMCVIAPPTPPH